MENPAGQLSGVDLALDSLAIRGAVAEQEQGPWAGLSARDIEARIAEVVRDLKAISIIRVRHVDWDSYGQGFASAVPVVISKSDDDAEDFRAKGRFGDFEGVVVALCKLAPLACVSQPAGERIGYEGMLGQRGFIDPDNASWAEALGEVDVVLLRHRIARLPPEVLNELIDPAVEIDTNFGRPPFTVFDAWFHWWD